MRDVVRAFARRHWDLPDADLDLELEPMHGGLESVVARARLRRVGAPQVPFVVKHQPRPNREAHLYAWLWAHLDDPPLALAYGEARDGDGDYLFLEDLQPSTSWPWADLRCAELVCRQLARLHDQHAAPPGLSAEPLSALARSAAETLAVALAARDDAGRRIWRRVGDLRRLVAAVPTMRRRLDATGLTLVHGDVHPGNVVVSDRAGVPRVVLIDWARARMGAPLEDVACWLHALGCWEPRARQRHDHLLRVYLAARRAPGRLDAALRADYWLASALNGLGGAIRYHLAMASDPAAPHESRRDAARALWAWQRVTRRAIEVIGSRRACG